MAERSEVSHHHAEAVVEGHGYTDPILFAVATALSDEVTVVEDVVVTQRSALREAGGAAGVLDVDRLVEVQRRHALAQLARFDRLAVREEGVPTRECRSERTLRDPAPAAELLSIMAA